MKKLLSVLLAVITVCLLFSGCNENADVDKTTSTTETTTTTTTRTTEDLSTTFKEAETNKIYPALEIDNGDGYSNKIATYQTKYDSSNTTRTTNINNAVSRLNNLVIPKDAVFSFNQVVGKRTVLAGYQEAKVVQGDEFVDGLGGGICQVSSTVFQAVLRANLKIKTRSCHSLEIGYVPLGGDATVQWNSQDFQFENNCGSDIRLKATAEKGVLTCTIYSKDKVSVGDVKVNIDENGEQYVLTRSVNGEINYTTYSKYSKAKPVSSSTTKKAG